MKDAVKMSERELRFEVIRHRITLMRVADMRDGLLAQTYSEIARKALRYEEGLHR